MVQKIQISSQKMFIYCNIVLVYKYAVYWRMLQFRQTVYKCKFEAVCGKENTV